MLKLAKADPHKFGMSEGRLMALCLLGLFGFPFLIGHYTRYFVSFEVPWVDRFAPYEDMVRGRFVPPLPAGFGTVRAGDPLLHLDLLKGNTSLLSDKAGLARDGSSELEAYASAARALGRMDGLASFSDTILGMSLQSLTSHECNRNFIYKNASFAEIVMSLKSSHDNRTVRRAQGQNGFRNADFQQSIDPERDE